MPAPAPAARPAGPSKKMSSSATMRVPTMRPGISRDRTATPLFTGRSSPTDSLASSRQRTPKRKASAPEPEGNADVETNINVVVRCRGRNDREVRENSGVVVSTDGIQGKKVELSMGPSALSNKAYQFDKVFSPAADQEMVFDEVVAPILDNVLSGFNCTIFAYGQTGTGKTYTMSGDISDVLPIPDAAGIVPRVLHSLFDRLEADRCEKNEHTVKCSFIELYNEELRDLLAADDSIKLKIFDDANKSGRTTTLVQGMEETHIESASKGIQLLRTGSHRRQVAATKCNDLSSRSHTVFAVTVYMKRTSDTGEEFLSSGKLNLVDLAGSENIQRSGAENKRAAEAGLINKSLLTLGRVINALVDKSSHIPYRESKLTRLLQDSLGGRTKTCIIATLSPAKSNLEETISTLDYAFRAKNIRNKPQINSMISKKTLLKEFTYEIEKLKSELIATRQRNGVYLTQENYEEITTQSESRRILSEEQRDKIETLEVHLRNRVQELFSLGQNFSALKKDTEQTRMMLDGTNDLLERTQLVLDHTKQSFAEETMLRKAHQETEGKLAGMGEELLATLGTTTDHVERLHSKLRRRSDLQSRNRMKWSDLQYFVANTTSDVEQRIEDLRSQQDHQVATLSELMRAFVHEELKNLQQSRSFLQEKSVSWQKSGAEVDDRMARSRDEMAGVLEEIRTLREDVKQKVGTGLDDLSAAAQRISAGIATELEAFHGQLQDSYVSLGREFKGIFEDLIKRLNEQQTENERLKQEMISANGAFAQKSLASQSDLQRAVQEQRSIAAEERDTMISIISGLITQSAATQEARFSELVESASKRLKTSHDEYRDAQHTYGSGMDAWRANSQALIELSAKNRDSIKTKLKTDWSAANGHTTRIKETTNAVHGETVRIVDGQMAQMDSQLYALDDIVARVKAQNGEYHKVHAQSLSQLVDNVHDSYSSIGEHFQTSYARTTSLQEDINQQATMLRQNLAGLDPESEIRQPLRQLREDAEASAILEYATTGETPAKTHYPHPTALPRTGAHEKLLNRMRGIPEAPEADANERARSPTKPKFNRSPTKRGYSSPTKSLASPVKQTVWADTPPSLPIAKVAPDSAPGRPTTADSLKPPTFSDTALRDINVNVAATSSALHQSLPETNITAMSVVDSGAKERERKIAEAPKLVRHKSETLGRPHGPDSKLPTKKSARQTFAILPEGRENIKPDFNASVGQGGGRWLRSRGSD